MQEEISFMWTFLTLNENTIKKLFPFQYFPCMTAKLSNYLQLLNGSTFFFQSYEEGCFCLLSPFSSNRFNLVVMKFDAVMLLDLCCQPFEGLLLFITSSCKMYILKIDKIIVGHWVRAHAFTRYDLIKTHQLFTSWHRAVIHPDEYVAFYSSPQFTVNSFQNEWFRWIISEFILHFLVTFIFM